MDELSFLAEFALFCRQLSQYVRSHFNHWFSRFELGKGVVVSQLYRKRGKYAQPFLHAAMTTLVFFGFAFGPTVFAQAFPGKEQEEQLWEATSETGEVLGDSSINNGELATVISDKPRAEVLEYVVRDGDTVSSIAKRFELSTDSIKWLNPDMNWQKIKPGQKIKIPPVDGVVHTVQPGETIYSIAKKYNTDPQAVADFPFNTFRDDNFGLTVKQIVIVPDGQMPDAPIEQPSRKLAKTLTPDAGSVSSSGTFVWPAYGRITQGFRWYHRGYDIANKDGGPIKAADAGVVVTAGWTPVGYGYHVIVDHKQSGYKTLYAHMSTIAVQVGQSVNKGDILGQMGSTGRSTGTHLHFEIIRDTVGKVDPASYLQ